MLKGLDITPEDPAELRSVNRLLANEVRALSLKVEQLQHQLAGHNRHRFGSKSESLDQLNLAFAEEEEIAEAAEQQVALHNVDQHPIAINVAGSEIANLGGSRRPAP